VNDTNFANATFYLFNSSFDLVNETNVSADVNPVNLSVNFTNLVDANERYYYNVTVRDKADNENTTAFRVITLDTLNPNINFSGGTADNNSIFSRNWIFVNVTAFDNNTANVTFFLYNSSDVLVRNVTYYAINNTNTSVNFTSLSNTDETYSYNVTMIDKAGNENGTGTLNITLDTFAPGIRLGSPLNGSWSSSSAIDLLYTALDTNLETCTLYHNESGIFADNGTNSSVSSDIQDVFGISLKDGSFMWNVLCNDSAGNSAYNSSNFSIICSPGLPVLQSRSGMLLRLRIFQLSPL